MPLSLAELRAQSGPPPLPRTKKVVTLIEGQHLLAESEQLADELMSIAAQVSRTDADGQRTGEPRKAGEGASLPRRAEAIKARNLEIEDELVDFQGEVSLTGITGGEWQRFKDENPPREDNPQDLQYAGGVCNASAVFAALGRFVSGWNGTDLAPGDWDNWLAERITYADRRDLVHFVVKMHEDGLAPSPKLRRSSSTTELSATD